MGSEGVLLFVDMVAVVGPGRGREHSTFLAIICKSSAGSLEIVSVIAENKAPDTVVIQKQPCCDVEGNWHPLLCGTAYSGPSSPGCSSSSTIQYPSTANTHQLLIPTYC